MTFVCAYLKDHMRILLMQGLFVCIFAVVFYLYHLPLVAVLYPTVICLLLGFLFTGYALMEWSGHSGYL